MPDYNLGTARGRIEIDASGATQGTREADRAVSGLAGNLSKHSNTIGKAGAGFAVVGATIAAGFGIAVKSAADFEEQISGIAAVSGATGPELEKIRQKALQLGKDTSFSASESAQAMSELVKAGIPLKGVLDGAADATVALAAAGGVDMPTAAAISANAMNQFGLSAKQMPEIANLIAGAANASAIDVTDFGTSMAQVGAVANLAGLSFQDTAVAIAEMGNAGIKGSDAGTSLKTFLTNLQPTTKKAADAMKDLGIITADGSNQFYDAQGNLKSLGEIQEILRKSTDGMTSAQKQATLQTLFGSDAIRAAAVLTKGGAKGYTEMAAAMGKVSAADVAKKRLDNFKGSLEQMKGSLETAGIVIGTMLLPALRALVNGITALANKFLNLSPATQKWILIIAGIVGVVALVVGAALTLAAVIGTVIGALAPLAAAIGIGVGALAGIVAVIPIVIAAVILLVVIIVRNWDTIKAKTLAVWDWIVAKVSGVWSAITGAVSAGFASVKAFFASGLAAIKAVWSMYWNATVAVIRTIFGVIASVITTYINIWKTVISVALAAIMAVWRAFWSVFGGLIKAVFGLIVAAVQLYMAVVGLVIRTALAGIKAVWTAVWGAISNFAKAVWARIYSVISSAATRVFRGLTRIFNAIRSFLTSAWNAIRGVATSTWNAIYSRISGPIQRAASVIRSQVNSAKNALNAAWNFIRSRTAAVFNGLRSTVSSALSRVYSAVSGIKSRILGYFSNAGSLLLSAGRSIIGGLINGITSRIGEVTAKLQHLTQMIKDAKGPEDVDKKLLTPAGEYIMDSLIRGFQRRFPDVLGTLSSLTTSIPVTVAAGIGSGVAPRPAAPAAGGGSSLPRSLTLVVGDREFTAYVKEQASAVNSEAVTNAYNGRKR